MADEAPERYFRNADAVPPGPGRREFLDALREALERLRPPQVRAAETLVSGDQAEILYAVIPHKELAGVSIAARLSGDEIAILWARIGGLANHDDLELGLPAGGFTLRGEGLSQSIALLEAELRRPIEVRAMYRDKDANIAKIEYWIEQNGKDIRVGTVLRDRVRCWNLYLPWRVEKYFTTFMTENSLPVSAPSGAEQWFKASPTPS